MWIWTVSQRPTTVYDHIFAKCLIWKILYLRIHQEIRKSFTFSTTPQLCNYTTLWNLKCDFNHFTTTAVTTYIEIHSVFLLTSNSYYLIHITTIYFWFNSNCLSCARSLVSSFSSSETMCQLNECTQHLCQWLPLQTYENWRYPHVFHQVYGFNTQIWTPTKFA